VVLCFEAMGLAAALEPTNHPPVFTLTIDSMTQSRDFFSRLVNWFSASGTDKAPINRPVEKRDPFSKLMNKISG
jgi:hypothetical protein